MPADQDQAGLLDPPGPSPVPVGGPAPAPTVTSAADDPVFQGGGECGALLRAMDWRTTPLPPPAAWPSSLRTLVAVMLGSQQPMLVVWGRELTTLYNDGYAAMCGARHPGALGGRFDDLWFEIWDQVRPIVEAAYAGRPTRMDDIRFVMTRNGYPEETHFAFSYTPVRDDSGAVAGFFCACTETTEQVSAQKATALRARLGDLLRTLEDPAEIMAQAARLLGEGLGLDGAGYADMDATGEIAAIERDWRAPGFPGVAGTHRLADYGEEIRADLRAGRVVRVDNAASDPRTRAGGAASAYDILGVGAFVDAPVVREGRLVGILFAISRDARVWTDTEAALVGEFAARTWSAVHRRRAEAALRSEHDRLQNVLASMAEGFTLLDREFRIRDVNSEALRLDGRDRDAVIGRSHWDVYPGTEQSELGRLYKKAVAEHVPVTLEHRYEWPDGRALWLDMRAYPTSDGLAVFWRDITDRKSAEGALEENEARLRLVQTAGRIGSFYWDMRSGRVFRSPEYLAIQGLPPDTPLEGPYEDRWLERVHPDDRARVEDGFRRDISRAGPFDRDYRIVRPDTGETRWIRNTGRVEADESGRPAYLLSAQTDVTDARRADEAVRESEARLRLAVQAARFAEVTFLVAEGGVRHGAAYAELLGYPAGHALTLEDVRSRYHPEDRERVLRERADILRSGQENYEIAHRIVTPAGETRWLYGRGQVTRDEAGRPLSVTALYLDETERKRAEEALRESEENYRHAAELNPQVAWTAAPDGRLDRVAERWREWTGASGLDDTWGLGLHPDDLDYSTDAWMRSVTTGEPYDVEHRVKRLNGEFRWARSRAFPRRDEAGRIVKWYGSTEDVHERKVAETALRESEAQLRLIADALPVLVSQVDTDERYRFVNRAYTEWFGRSREETLGRTMREVLGDAAHDVLKPRIRAAMAGETVRFESLVPYRIGGPRHIEASYIPKFSFDGRTVEGLYVLVADIGERKRQEIARNESEARFRNVADHAPLMMWVTEADGSCSYLNRRWYEFTGQTEADALGFGWLSAVHPDDAARAEEVFRTANARQESFRLEYRLRRQDGVYRWAIDAAAPRFADSGEFLGYVGSVLDIDERHEAEVALRSATALAEDLAAEQAAILGQLVEGVIVADADGRIAYVNQAAANLHGVARLDVSPEAYSRTYGLYREDGRPYPTEELPLSRAVRRGETSLDERWVIERPDGRRVLAIGSARPTFAADGTRLGAVLTVRDDTARAANEAALRASEERFRTLADVLPAFVWFASPDGALHYLNDRWYEYTGQTPDAALPSGWADVLHPDDVERTAAAWSRSLEEGSTYEIEVRYRRRDGTYRWYVARAEPLRDDAGRVTGWFGASADIHDRREAEAALRASEQRFRGAVEAVQGVLWTNDADGRMTGEQPGWAAMTGQSFEAYQGFGWADAVHPEDAAPTVEAWTEAVRERRTFVFEHRLRRSSDGAWRRYSIRAIPMLRSDGSVREWVGVHTDVTELREAETHLRLLVDELNHRVKNTLAIVQGLAVQTFKGEAASEAARQAFEGRLTALATAHNVLTRELWESADLRDVVEGSLRAHVQDASRFSIEGPPVRLQPKAAVSIAMAVHELATNALKYGALSVPEGRVRVVWNVRPDTPVRLFLRWAESDGPPVRAPERRGFGSRMIERALAGDLNGAARLNFEPGGLVCEIEARLRDAEGNRPNDAAR